MRFHRLVVTAFGPYAGSETVNFDELNASGVFLLTGPTGAGKTSILDALCFALYGVVPGERGTKALQSHHATPELRPEVTLELTLGQRRFRVTRSPEWVRPKKRGEGSTRDPARASLTEVHEDGTEVLLSARAQEVGHELGDLLGMSSDQFMQVVLLPQGEFQTFLHATSDERQVVLERLFHTQRFTRIEGWLRQRSSALREQLSEHERAVGELLAKLAHRAAAEVPEAVRLPTADTTDTLVATACSRASQWAEQLLADAQTALGEVTARAEEATRAVAQAESADRDASRLVEAATGRRAPASHSGVEHVGMDRGVLLERHLRAVLVAPRLAVESDARSDLERARAVLDEAAAAVSGLEETVQLERLSERLTSRAASLRSLLPREAGLAEERERLRAMDDRRGQLVAARVHDHDRATTLPAEQQDLAARLVEDRLVAADVSDAEAAAAAAARAHDAAVALPDAAAEHRRLVEAVRVARDLAADAREAHLATYEARLEGFAAELAGQLHDGAACQVCGATEHPAPAHATTRTVTEDDQRRARAEADRLRTEHERLATLADDSAEIVNRLAARAAAMSADEAETALVEARRRQARAAAAAARVPDLEARAEQLATEAETLAARLAEAEDVLSSLDQGRAALAARVTTAEDEIRGSLEPDEADVAGTLAALESQLRAVRAATEAAGRLDHVAQAHRRAAAQADAVAHEHGFASAAEAADALLPQEQAHRLREATRLTLASARAADRSATGDARTAEETVRALGALSTELARALAAWAPAAVEHLVADDMARLVRGMGTDNHLQMRLSSYVLATRLDQVLDAANERLGLMQDQRYTLSRTGRARRGARAGLGLEVLDSWTGETRDPTTLSGGETFVVSLALALGLADVVSHEAGGLRVDTLFVDEGFGMLDAETLDDVMDRIDGLRAGGRTVGVVSHVSELRTRIPTQVHVTKGRTGSTIEVRTLVA